MLPEAAVPAPNRRVGKAEQGDAGAGRLLVLPGYQQRKQRPGRELRTLQPGRGFGPDLFPAGRAPSVGLLVVQSGGARRTGFGAERQAVQEAQRVAL